jgi:hypothetical protein
LQLGRVRSQDGISCLTCASKRDARTLGLSFGGLDSQGEEPDMCQQTRLVREFTTLVISWSGTTRYDGQQWSPVRQKDGRNM